MAVVYFTSNASTGAGSLAEAIKNASPGDVIRPDESVFERGSTIEIVLASALTINKTLTLDGGPYRVRLNGDGRPRCCAIESGVSVEITSFDFIGGGWNSQTGANVGSSNGGGIYVPSGSTVALTRCGFLGCRGTYGGGVYIAVDSIGTLSDCVIAGCYARGLAGGAFCNGTVKIYGSTIVGNAASDADVLAESKSAGTVLFNCIVGKFKGKVETDAGSVVDVASSAIGFVESPPDNFSVESWSPNAWRNWDLRLLDDASPNPSPHRDSGNVDTMTQYDFDGNFRGRETNDVATCSPGAYETMQADLFWIGVNAGVPTFSAADGWATSRFAEVSGSVAPSTGDRLYIGLASTFNDAAPANAYVIVNSSPVVIETTGGGLETSIGSAVSYSGALDSMRFGDWTKISLSGAAELPPIAGGSNLVFAGTAVTVLDGVIFASVVSPSDLTPVNGGGWADVTAGVTSVSATALSESVVEITIEKTSANKTAFVQYSADDGTTWMTVATTANENVYDLMIPAGTFAIIRSAVDGGWLTAIASTAGFVPVWTVENPAELVTGIVNAFEISTGGSNTGNNSYNLSGWGVL